MSNTKAQFIAKNLESHEQQSTEIRSLVLTSQQTGAPQLEYTLVYHHSRYERHPGPKSCCGNLCNNLQDN